METVLLGSRALGWVAATATAPTPLEALAVHRADKHRDNPIAAVADAAPFPLDEPPSAVPLLRLGRACRELLVRHVLPSRQPGVAAEAGRLGEALVGLLARQQTQLAAALVELPPVLTDEYDAAREMRLEIWRALLSSPATVPALLAASVPETLILVGALPHARPLRASWRVPPSFLPHEGSLALRLEGIEMLAALLDRLRVPALEPVAEQLFAALRRHAVVPTEVARVRAREQADASAGGLRASAAVILALLDRAADMRAWQLLEESDAAATIFELYDQTRAQPAELRELLTAGHAMHKPLARAAATFVHGMFEFERAALRTHPLVSSDMRVLYASSGPQEATADRSGA